MPHVLIVSGLLIDPGLMRLDSVGGMVGLIVVRMLMMIGLRGETSGGGTRREIGARSVGHQGVVAIDGHGGRRHSRIQLHQGGPATGDRGGAQQLLPQAATAVLDPLELRLEEHNLLLEGVNPRVFGLEDCRESGAAGHATRHRHAAAQRGGQVA